jgi:LmbE family N-acetylglucosaminyl deacetylase
VSTIVSLHAHPDDEALLSGGWLAQRAAAGDRVVVAFATDGAAGLATGHAAGTLGRERRREAEAAALALGADRVVWLGYADSGMADAPSPTPGTGPGRLADAPAESVAEAVAGLLDAEDADVLTGYDARGGYGHPDHVQVHRAARLAQDLAVRRPVLLEATLDRTWLVRLLRLVRPAARLLPGLTLPGDDIFSSRAELTRRVDVRDHLDAKRAALAAHASQATGGIRTVALLLRLPRPVARLVLGTEWFIEHP